MKTQRKWHGITYTHHRHHQRPVIEPECRNARSITTEFRQINLNKVDSHVSNNSSRQSSIPDFSETRQRESLYRFQEEWFVIKRLGRGSESTVFYCARRCDIAQLINQQNPLLSNVRVPISVAKFIKHDSDAAKYEVEALSKRIPHTAEFVGYKAFDRRERLWYVTKVQRGGTVQRFLQHYRSSFPPALLWHIFIEVVGAVAKLHSYGIAHCDIFSANLFVDPEHQVAICAGGRTYPKIRLGDWGRSMWITQCDPTSRSQNPVKVPDLELAMHRDIVDIGNLVHHLRHGLLHETAKRNRTTGHCACTEARAIEAVGGHEARKLYRDIMRATARDSAYTAKELYRFLVPPAVELRSKQYESCGLKQLELNVPGNRAVLAAMEDSYLQESVWHCSR